MAFLDAFNRIRLETNLQTQEQLARFLGIKQSSVSGAKKRGQFPRAWAEKVGRHYSLRYEWIMEGLEPRRIGDTRESSPSASPATGYYFSPEILSGAGNDLLETQALLEKLGFVLLRGSHANRNRLETLIEELYQKTKKEARET